MPQDKQLAFNNLIADVKACTKCERMANSERVIGHSCGNINASIMFIGEAPGRLGADDSQIPFHGDQSGHNFEALLEQADLTRYQLFVTNAVLCNPKTSEGNNSTPTTQEVSNCAPFLKRQIELIDPATIVTLGSTSLKAVNLIEAHKLSLSASVRTKNKWYGRHLIPIYHPGQRAMIHRSFANQLSDYYFVAETLKRSGKSSKSSKGTTGKKVSAIVDYITSLKPDISYFGLHKIFYLIEHFALQTLGHRLTNSYIIRQKDGPYCVDLNITKLRRALPHISIVFEKKNLVVRRTNSSLFPDERNTDLLLDPERKIIENIIDRYGQLSNVDLKRVSYLTSEMRTVLRLERKAGKNLLNAPLLEPSSTMESLI